MPLDMELMGLSPAEEDAKMAQQELAMGQQGPNVATTEQTPNLEQNKAKWRQLFDKARTDPNIKQGMMQVGLGLMRSPQMGQTGWDVASNAAQMGISTVQALRERDKKDKQETEDRDLNRRDKESAISARNTTAAATAKGAETDYQKYLATSDLARKQHDLAVQELESLDTYRKGQIKNDAQGNKIKADNAANGGGSQSADVAKINNLTAEYVAQGMDPIKAKAQATRDVMTTGKGNAASVFNQAMKQELELWGNNFDNLGKTPDPKTISDMQNRAKERTKAVMQLSGEPAPVAPGAGIARTDQEKYNALINAAKAKGATPEQIKQTLINEKQDPKQYGY